MKILHLTVHLGGGVGKAITGMLNKEDTVILLEKPEKDYYVKIAEQKAEAVLIEPSADILERKMEQADVIVINWWGHPLMAGFLAKFPKVKCRLVIWNHVNGCVYPYLPYLFLNEFDEVLFTTKFSYENPMWTEEQRKNITEKSGVVYGVGEFYPKQMNPKEDYQKKENFTVGYLGTLNYAKLNPNFVKYCEAAEKKIQEIRFCLVGELFDEVKADIEKSPIADKFEIIHYVEDVETWYKKFDVLGYLINGYNYATTDQVLLEAMAYGIPIVVLNNDVEKHIIHDSINGFVVDTPQEYAKCLEKLYEKTDIRKQIGKQAREYVCKTYHCAESKKKFDENMEKCIKLKKRTHVFESILGKTPYEIFQSFLNTEERQQMEEIKVTGNLEGCELHDVFRQKSKGSVNHFCRYFQEDENLKRLKECLENDKSGGEK